MCSDESVTFNLALSCPFLGMSFNFVYINPTLHYSTTLKTYTLTNTVIVELCKVYVLEGPANLLQD